MKRVVSVSLGSSKRDHAVTTELAGEQIEIRRIGMDGDLDRVIRTVRELDGSVDALGIGGIDLYVRVSSRRYLIHGAVPIKEAAQETPIVDGSGLKNTIERRLIAELEKEGLSFAGRRVLVVSALDRFGMAEALEAAGARLIIGDLIFALKIPLAIHSLRMLETVAKIVAPAATRLPLSWLYPMGEEQELNSPDSPFKRFYDEAEILAGDFHFIRRYLPQSIEGKTIITNTTTEEDVTLLARRGADRLITTTPRLDGRSFGTNVMEALIVALSGKRELSAAEYDEWLKRIDIRPHIQSLKPA